MTDNTAIDPAYLAGCLDGEGTFALDGRISVDSTDEVLIRDLAEQYGGSVSYLPPRTERHRPQWRWRVSRKRALVLVGLVLPYLRTKRPHAHALYLAQSHPEAGAAALRVLNRRGPG